MDVLGGYERFVGIQSATSRFRQLMHKTEKLRKYFESAHDLPEHGTRNLRLHDINRVPSSRHVDFVLDDDFVYIFKPTAEQYSSNFAELLALMEKTAGRIQGVVKVMIPNEW